MNNEGKIAELGKQISDERQHIAADRMDFSIGELVNMYENGELIIHPEYQRLFRWTDTQKTALIESILLGIPVPPIFVAEDENGVWEVVDGLQRLSTLVSFFGKLRSGNLNTTINEENDEENDDDDIVNTNNKWYLEKGDILKSLEGFNVDTLPSKYVLNIKRASLRVEILRGQSRVTMKYELFKRLNSNGTKLTAQEIRNAIYRGIDSCVNKLVEKLSKNPAFVELTTLTKQKKKELYDQELVLRFMAFYDKNTEINNNTAKILDDFMDRSVNDSQFDSAMYENIFNKTIVLLEELNDSSVFKNANNFFVPAYFEAIMLGVANNIEAYSNDTALLSDKIKELKESQEFKQYMGSASNSKKRIERRLEIALRIFEVK